MQEEDEEEVGTVRWLLSLAIRDLGSRYGLRPSASAALALDSAEGEEGRAEDTLLAEASSVWAHVDGGGDVCEYGHHRPRLALRLVVDGLTTADTPVEAYRRHCANKANPLTVRQLQSPCGASARPEAPE